MYNNSADYISLSTTTMMSSTANGGDSVNEALSSHYFTQSDDQFSDVGYNNEVWRPRNHHHHRRNSIDTIASHHRQHRTFKATPKNSAAATTLKSKKSVGKTPELPLSYQIVAPKSFMQRNSQERATTRPTSSGKNSAYQQQKLAEYYRSVRRNTLTNSATRRHKSIVRRYRNTQRSKKVSLDSDVEMLCTEPVALDYSPTKDSDEDLKDYRKNTYEQLVKKQQQQNLLVNYPKQVILPSPPHFPQHFQQQQIAQCSYENNKENENFYYNMGPSIQIDSNMYCNIPMDKKKQEQIPHVNCCLKKLSTKRPTTNSGGNLNSNFRQQKFYDFFNNNLNDVDDNDNDETQFMNITDKIYENLNLQTFVAGGSSQQQQQIMATTSATTAINSGTNSSNSGTASTSSGVSSNNSGESVNNGFLLGGGDEPELYGRLVGLVFAETRRNLNRLNWRRVKEALQALESLFGIDAHINPSLNLNLNPDYYRPLNNAENDLLWLQYDDAIFHKYSSLFCAKVAQKLRQTQSSSLKDYNEQIRKLQKHLGQLKLASLNMTKETPKIFSLMSNTNNNNNNGTWQKLFGRIRNIF